ncbi:hypothetical protein GCK72_015738 [Caenorhabditis remanei]|uniref:Uncharacterized protein n=1 Tax=Caenorhabditis remanei TaxID=31234 RepID=A0A6A5GXE0_CAERE|nr:hypothetical protein GCK72_015738 [Caenorhabditis remanei]KAF1759274.1 hypothetical protein GCK72_015738 [Caenorhabditis remanei]
MPPTAIPYIFGNADKANDSSFPPCQIQTDSLKVPEVQCGRNYSLEGTKMIDDLAEKYPKDSHKQLEQWEALGDDTWLSCFIPLRDEINCKHKECEGSEDSAVLCICGPKKCKMGSDGLCEKKGSKDGDGKDEKDGSSSLFVLGTMLNLTIFYLISSFF